MALPTIQPLIKQLSHKMFEAERRRLETILVQIDKQNREIKGQTLQGFMHAGKIYRPKSAPTLAVGAGSYPTLAFALQDQMAELLRDTKEVETDQQLIEQILYKLLYQANDRQEIRDALPECLVQLTDLNRLNRKLSPGFLNQSDERTYRQFQAILPKIEMYCTTRLLY